MSIIILKAGVRHLVAGELEIANNKYPPFNSRHEGYAVIREEWKEHRQEARRMAECVGCLEDGVFGDRDVCEDLAALEKTAVNAACEAIQTAAMCRKLRALEGASNG